LLTTRLFAIGVLLYLSIGSEMELLPMPVSCLLISVPMKGPFERQKYDLRRLWECPVCHKRERTPGSVTSRLCMCQMKQADGTPVVMKLLEDGPQRVVPPVVIEHEPLPPLPPLVIEPPPAAEPLPPVMEAPPIPVVPIAPPPPPAEPPTDAS
jgi:hypothetical protein